MERLQTCKTKLMIIKTQPSLRKWLKSEGFEKKKPFTKQSQSQAKVESIMKSFKVCFKAYQMPGSTPLTIVSFMNVVRRFASLLNSKPVAILPPSLSDPDEILSVSPNSLTGQSSSTWWALGSCQKLFRPGSAAAVLPNEILKILQIVLC